MAKSQNNFTPSVVSSDDLYQVGMMAVIRGLSSYDRDKGAGFTTYVYLKIKGAMQDHLRAVSPVSRNRNSPMHSLDADLEMGMDYSRDQLPPYEIMKLLDGLEGDQRRALLFRLHGLDVRTIARLLGIRFYDCRELLAEATLASEANLTNIQYR